MTSPAALAHPYRRPRVSAFLVSSLLSIVLTGSSVAAAPIEVPVDMEPDLHAYLGVDAETAAERFDPEIPTPASVLGFEVGEWHVRHDLLVQYMKALAEASDRVRIEVTGHTYEQRPLLLLTVSSPENLARLEEIRSRHLELGDPSASAEADLSQMPVVVNLGYSVHGNEPSGSNASLVVAYALAADRDPETVALLDRAVILLDPSLNPDGLSRFAQWANMHKGAVPVALAQSREHQEGWPSGRTNHYWFDLNRDWLPAQHPESRARLAAFHDWRPNVLTDHHEMGSDATFFFQPGVPSRKNPLTPDRNVELTQALAEHHARALDALGSSYYTEESFDDFYYGKGSTFPDVHGAVGILFEQASSRGHLRDAENGPGGRLSFPFTIRNQVAVSFSTLRGAVAERQSLLAYQRDFYRDALAEGRQDSRGAWIFGDAADPARAAALAEVLRLHRIELHRPGRALTVDGVRYEPESSYVVPTAQPQYRLARAAFDSWTEFQDATFYDVSAWTLPMAYGLSFGTLGSSKGSSEGSLLGERIEEPPSAEGSFTADPKAHAYVFTWHGYFAPRSLYRLLDAGVEARVATAGFSASIDGAVRELPQGTVVLPLGLQTVARDRLEALLARAAEEDGLHVHAVATGLTPAGIDLGSPSLERLERPRPAIVVEDHTSAYEAGAAWHLLDHRFGIETALIPVRDLKPEVLDRLTHVILVDGAERAFDAVQTDRLRSWVSDRGGVVVAIKGAAEWAGRSLVDPGPGSGDEATQTAPTRRPYGSASADRAVHLVGGTIFEAELDLTHPLAYGYTRERLPVFRNSRLFLPPSSNPYATVVAYAQDPLLAGYASEENQQRLSGAPSLIADRLGEGTVVQMIDDPNFRAFWWGTNKLFLNALFFGSVIDRTAPDSERFRDGH